MQAIMKNAVLLLAVSTPVAGLVAQDPERSKNVAESALRRDAVDRPLRLSDWLALTQDDEDAGSDGNIPKVTVSGFGHVTFNFENDDPDVGASTDQNNLALGGLDLFITSQITENVSFLNETLFEPTEDGDYVLDVERVVIKYEASDSFNIQAGRMHTMLGYWNDAFHHGEFLQASIGRPAILNFEDENGLLPVHNIGLRFVSTNDVSFGTIEGILEIGNGRGAVPDPPQLVTDANDMKSVNVRLAVSPFSVEGLKASIGYMKDKIPVNTDAAAGPVHGSMNETILSASAAYVTGPWEVIAEYFAVNHDGSGIDADSNGWFVSVGHRYGNLIPFVRYDVTDLDDTDTFFMSTDDTSTLAVGVRWDFEDYNAIKIQLNQTATDVTGGADTDTTGFHVQWSFAF